MQGLLDYLTETRAFEESTLEAIVRNLVARTRDYRCMRSPCGAGDDYLVVNAHGDVYPCARFVGDEGLRLGNVSDGRPLEGRANDNRLVRQMRERTVACIPECRECTWRHLCEAGCALGARAHHGAGHPDPLCEFYRAIYPHMMAHLYHHPEMAQHFLPQAIGWRVGGSPPPATRPTRHRIAPAGGHTRSCSSPPAPRPSPRSSTCIGLQHRAALLPRAADCARHPDPASLRGTPTDRRPRASPQPGHRHLVPARCR